MRFPDACEMVARLATLLWGTAGLFACEPAAWEPADDGVDGRVNIACQHIQLELWSEQTALRSSRYTWRCQPVCSAWLQESAEYYRLPQFSTGQLA
eukprot:scaffold2911_cov414-Prasinococcus_capsulatus_cf.AAC.25